MLNKKVIIRGAQSGEFFGALTAHNGQEVELVNCRRIWYWRGAASLSQMAVNGVKSPDDCKFTATVNQIAILDAIEIIPCTDKAIQSITSVPKCVPEWKI